MLKLLVLFILITIITSTLTVNPSLFAQEEESSPESSSTPSLDNNDDVGSGSQDEVPQDSEGTDNGSGEDNTDDPGNGDSSVVLTICPDGTTVSPPVECLPCPKTTPKGHACDNVAPTTSGGVTQQAGIDTRNTTTPTDELMINQTGLINNNNVTGTGTENLTLTARGEVGVGTGGSLEVPITLEDITAP